MALLGLVAANNLSDIVDRERAWDNLGSSLATGDIAIPTPSLDLNFAANKSLIDDISGNNLITFSRASSGTFIGSDGLIQTAASGVPRFDHNPTTSESLGLLVEEARTNQLLYSQGVTGWTLTGVTATPNNATAPDNTQTAILLSDDSSTSTHGVSRSLTNNAAAISLSAYVKRGTARYFAIGLSTTTPNASACFDFDNPTVITYQAGSITNFSNVSLLPLKDGWFRIVASHPGMGGGTGFFTLFVLNNQPVSNGGMNAFNFLSYAGSSSLSLYYWGLQAEYGATPTSYIPTVASTVTRAADVASITGVSFSDWFNPSVGTFFSDSSNERLSSDIATSTYNAINTIAFSLGQGSSRVYTPIFSYLTDNTIYAQLFQYNGVGTDWGPQLQSTIPRTSNVEKVAVFTDITYNLSGIATAGQVAVESKPGNPISTGELSYSLAQSMVVGYNTNYYGTYTGRIKRIAYWSSRLSNEALKYITEPLISSVNVYSFSFGIKGRDVLALEGVRNASTRDFIFVKGLLSAAQPRLTTAATNASSLITTRNNALSKLAPVSSGNYLFASGLTLSGNTTRINGINALSIATSPFSGSTATAPLLFRELRPQANWRITESMSSGTIASPDLAIPFETDDFVLFMKAGQN